MRSEAKQAVVLAGGMGTRLRPLTNTRPKPLLPILGRPCVEYVLRALGGAGVGEVYLTCGYRSADMMEALGDGSQYGVRMQYNIEETPAGTAGAVKLLESRLEGTFVVASGDVLADVDIAALVRQHKQRGAVATMALTTVDQPEEFGIVGLDENGRIVRFKEKPRTEEVFSNLINAGIYVLEPEVLSEIPSGKMYDFSRDLFPSLLEKRLPIYGSQLSGLWKDIGRPSDLLEANLKMADRKGGEVCVEGARIQGKIVATSFKADGTVIRGPAYIGENCSLGRSAVLSSCALGDYVQVWRNARVDHSLIMDGCVLGDGCMVRGSVLGEGCRIGPGVAVTDSTLGDGVSLEGPASLHGKTLE